jgi:hypothetical protein
MAVRIASKLQAYEIRRGYLRLIYNIVAVHLEAFARGWLRSPAWPPDMERG